MKIRVLGSAAGGGFPQWNCNCRNCTGVRGGTLRAHARTQSSIAVRAHDPTGGTHGGGRSASWALVNASPDILTQLRANPDFQPARSARDTAICAIVLVDGQVDHTTGLYMLRESTRPWALWCTDTVCADLELRHPIFQVLSHFCGIERRRVALDGSGFAVEGVPGVRWQALPVAGKPAPYSPNREVPLADYATPGTQELVESLEPLVHDHNAILMANHGVVTYGEDLLTAYMRMETVEHFAKIALTTHMLGKQNVLSPERVAQLTEIRKKIENAKISSLRKQEF